jgi:uncharacterized damage-inducible protein DinB
MSTDRTHDAPNRAERERLRALVARLSDADLGRPMSAGWTVAAVLGHLAFWDQRLLVLLEGWRASGQMPRPLHDGDVDWINDSTKPMLLALAPRRAADLALSTAEAVDAAVAALPDALIAGNAAAGHPLRLLRAEHRRQHLDEIEAARKDARA